MSLLALLSGRGREVVVSLVGSRLRVPPDGVQSDVTTGAATTHFEGVWQYALLYSCRLFCTVFRMTFGRPPYKKLKVPLRHIAET